MSDKIVRSFTCEMCKRSFNVLESDNWTEEDAQAEFSKLYPGCDPKDTAITCDDCHNLVQAWRSIHDQGGTLQ